MYIRFVPVLQTYFNCIFFIFRIHFLTELYSVMRISQKIHEVIQDRKQAILLSEASSGSNSLNSSQLIYAAMPKSTESSTMLAEDELPTADSNQSHRAVDLLDVVSTPIKVEEIGYSSLILCGDYLMATVIKSLASLRNSKVNTWDYLMATVIKSLASLRNSNVNLNWERPWQKQFFVIYAPILKDCWQPINHLLILNYFYRTHWIEVIIV